MDLQEPFLIGFLCGVIGYAVGTLTYQLIRDAVAWWRRR